MSNREKIEITGVRDVLAFDENQVILDTDMGLLTIKGKDLHVKRLTLEKGEADLDGTADSLSYSSNEAYRKSGESLFARLFK
ncbi:MAG: sporulation protein YabP [bacterium]|nr:sporulation protein YabP [bacterium]